MTNPNGTFAYVVNSAAWSVVGAAIVLILQRLRGRKTMPHREKNFRLNWATIIALLVLVIAVGNAVLGYQIDRRQRNFVACQAHVNQVRTEQLNRLQELAKQDRATVDQLIRSVVNAPSREQVRDALTRYIKQRDETERERQKQGPIQSPTDLCGTPPPS